MQTQYYRTFIALPLRFGEDLLQLRHEIMTAMKDERISWVDPGHFHVTLRFLGDTSLGDVNRISAAMTGDRFIHHARKVPVSGVESFGPAKKPRVIWVSFGEAPWFREMKADVDEWLEDLGIPSPDHTFTAHLTLGRIRSLRSVPDFHAFMEGMKVKSCATVSFDRLVYYRSILETGGPKYSQLAEVIFNAK